MVGRILGLVVVAALTFVQERPVGAYKILMIPIPGKSHLFAMAAMAEGLASRGHHVGLLVGEHFPTDDLPEVDNSSMISVIRHGDSDDSGALDYEAMIENVTSQEMTQHSKTSTAIPAIRNWCVQCFFGKPTDWGWFPFDAILSKESVVVKNP